MKFIEPNWPAPKHIKAFTTLKQTWGCGDYQSPELRQALVSLLQLPSTPIWLDQKHTNKVVQAAPEMQDQIADAAFTQIAQRVCVIITADCLPILITNKQGTEVAAIHAGWRSLASGIIENTVKQLTSESKDLLVWLGPAIGPLKFEVGIDVYDAFTTLDNEATKAFTPHTAGKWHANLYTLAKQRLARLGVHTVYGGDFCTHTQEDLFYSYRRDKGSEGRMANVIWIEQA